MQARSYFGLAAALMLSAAVCPPAFASDPPAVPTPRSFGRPLPPKPEAAYPIARGLLRCTTAAEDDCVVHGMALINQENPILLPQLEAFLTPYAKNGVVPRADGSSGGTPAQYAQAILDNACYDASMTVIIAAALANRASDIIPAKRSATFDEIKAEGDLNKIENQFLWKNEIQFEQEHQVLAGGTPVQAFHFPEVVADVSGGIDENCNPLVYGNCDGKIVHGKNKNASGTRLWAPFNIPLSNAYIKEQLQEGKLPLVGYVRYQPQTVFDAATGVLSVSFMQVSMHKVPFSGFQPGAWPLAIADVGDGMLRHVSIGTNLHAMEFTPPGDTDAHRVKSVSFTMPTGVAPNTPFVVYEDAADQTRGPNPLIFFISNYDYLYINNVKGPPRKS
jgi:hypothetical protein